MNLDNNTNISNFSMINAPMVNINGPQDLAGKSLDELWLIYLGFFNHINVLNTMNVSLNQALINKDVELNLLRKELYDIEKLKAEIINLMTVNTTLTNKLETSNVRTDKLEQDVAELKTRDKPITVREAMRILEKYICLEVAGSKTKLKKCYSIEKIKDGTVSEYKTKLEEIKVKYGMTDDHFDMLAYFRETGGFCANKIRSVLTRENWNLAIMEEDDNDDDKIIKLKLLEVLERFSPCESNELWKLEFK